VATTRHPLSSTLQAGVGAGPGQALLLRVVARGPQRSVRGHRDGRHTQAPAITLMASAGWSSSVVVREVQGLNFVFDRSDCLAKKLFRQLNGLSCKKNLISKISSQRPTCASEFVSKPSCQKNDFHGREITPRGPQPLAGACRGRRRIPPPRTSSAVSPRPGSRTFLEGESTPPYGAGGRSSPAASWSQQAAFFSAPGICPPPPLLT